MCRKYDELQKEIEAFRSNKTGYIKRDVYMELVTEHEQLKKEHQHNNKMVNAWKSQCGRFQSQNLTKAEEIEKHEQLQQRFHQQIELMKSQANSLQAQLDHQRQRAEMLNTQLTSHQIQEGDEDYDIKIENCQLQAIR